MHLYKVVFIATFSNNKRATFGSAFLRVGLLAMASAGLGSLLAGMLPPLPPASMATALFCSGVFITQLVVFTTLVAAYGIVRPMRSDMLARLLLYLPMRRLVAWGALLLPGVIIAFLTLCFLAPSYFSLLAQLGINWSLSLASLLLGTISALGWIYGFPRRLGLLQGTLVIASFSLEYWLLQRMYAHVAGLEIVSWALTIAVGIILVVRSSFYMCSEASIPQKHRPVIGEKLPVWFWFFKKLYRNATTCVGMLITICMSLVIGAIFWRLDFWDLGLVGAIVALLVAALSSDIRSLSSKHQPIEIVGLRGVFYFSKQQFLATVSMCLLTVSPLVGMAIVQLEATNFSTTFRDIGLPMLLGIGSGLFSSSLFAPGPRDVTAQVSATLLATGIFLLPQLSVFSQLTEAALFIIRVTLTLLLLTLAVFIEYKRNPFIWRNKNDTNL